MKKNKTLTITLVASILLVTLSVCYFFLFYLPSVDEAKKTVDNYLKCNQLYELKKDKYWGTEIGQNRVIYSKHLNTCLAMNMYNNFSTKDYYAMVIDMSDDSTILDYSSKPKGFYVEGDKRITCTVEYDYLSFLKNGKKTNEYGCENTELFDKMISQIRTLGFQVFDGLQNN